MERNKEQIIGRIRKCSLVISIICLAVALLNGYVLYHWISGTIGIVTDGMTQTDRIRIPLGYGFTIAIMLLFAILFFSMSGSGRPFTPKKIRMMLLIGVLMLLNALIPAVIMMPSIGIKTVFYLLTSTSLPESLMFLFAALIMYYASILQQESDETL